MDSKQQVFKAFFKENIGSVEQYIGMANVIAENINQALEIAQTYGPVDSINKQDGVIIAAKKEAVEAQSV